MALFGRRKRQDASADEAGNLEPAVADAAGRDDTAETSGSPESAPATRAGRRTPERTPDSDGPYDVSEVDGPSGRLDLGSIWIAAVEGMRLQLDVTPDGSASKITIALAGSTLEMNAFAAPKTSGIWSEIREEISQSVAAGGGSAEVVDGPCGTELLARIPRRGPDGATAYAAARFLGVDGPRWFLRAVITGPAASEPSAAEPFVTLFRSAVVNRGGDAMAPREVLPLRVPDEQAPRPTAQESRFGPLEQGPTIAEVR